LSLETHQVARLGDVGVAMPDTAGAILTDDIRLDIDVHPLRQAPGDLESGADVEDL
jgi:hypothetical protein